MLKQIKDKISNRKNTSIHKFFYMVLILFVFSAVATATFISNGNSFFDANLEVGGDLKINGTSQFDNTAKFSQDINVTGNIYGNGYYGIDAGKVSSGTFQSGTYNMPTLNVTSQFTTIDPYVDVRAYGADGTDGSSDLQAFQNAIDADTTNVVIYIPCGTFYFDGQLNLTSSSYQKITFKGEGECSVIKASNGADSTMFSLSDADYITFENFVIDGNNANNVGVSRVINTGFYTDHGIIRDMIFKNTISGGMYLNGVQGWKIHDNKFLDIGESTTPNTEGAISINRATNMRIYNNYIDGVYSNGIRVDSATGVPDLLKGMIQIDGNVIRELHNDQSSGIHVLDPSNLITINNNLFYNFNQTSAGINAIFITGNDAVISGNIGKNITGVGLEIGGANHQVIGNSFTFLGNGTAGSGAFISGGNITFCNNYLRDSAQHGISLNGVDDNVIVCENTVINPRQSGSFNAAIRIIKDTTNVDNIQIINNMLIGNTTTPYGIYQSGTGTVSNITIAGNTFKNLVNSIGGLTTSEIAPYCIYNGTALVDVIDGTTC